MMGLMFLQSDGGLFLVADLGPLTARNDGHRQPVHRQGEIVEAAKVHVERNLPELQRMEKMLGERYRSLSACRAT
jgi:hypothetical protein